VSFARSTVACLTRQPSRLSSTASTTWSNGQGGRAGPRGRELELAIAERELAAAEETPRIKGGPAEETR